MSIESWAIYLATVLALVIMPGPSQFLMLSSSATNGFRKSLAIAAGDLTANCLQMLAAGLGLATIIAASSHVMTIIKWTGVLYLTGLGIHMIRKASSNQSKVKSDAQQMSVTHLWVQGFLTSGSNPNAIIFFAALFPLFISTDHTFWPQFFVLSTTYLAIDGLFLSLYGYGAIRIIRRLNRVEDAWIGWISGGVMILAATLLGLKSAT